MNKVGMLLGTLGLGLLLLTGCAAKLSESDQARLDQALQAADSAAQSAQRAERYWCCSAGGQRQ